MNRLFKLLLLIVSVCLYSCGTSESQPVLSYYEYDKAVPLEENVELVKDTTAFKQYHVTYRSVHYKEVTALLTVPKQVTEPIPTIILMHGLGDHKQVDYVEYGNEFLLKNGFAVLRLDFSKHGERKEDAFDFDLTGDHKYWSRNIISQTVFDLRKAVDFIETRPELDHSRIGYYGISLGGITGTIFCGVEPRIKVPVIILAGGQLNLLYESDALSSEAKDFVSVVEPVNFVGAISPRPLLMINAENDEVVPPMMSKILFNNAEQPKEIKWYDAKHRNAPLDKVYQDGVDWYNKYLK